MSFYSRYLIAGWSMILFLAGALYATDAHATKAEVSDEPPELPLVTVPIDITNNRLHVTFQVQGEPVRMLLDTGASISILFESDHLQADMLPLSEPIDISFPAFRTATTGHRLPRIQYQLNAFSYASDDTIFIRHRHEISEKLGDNIDGILGRDFFEAYIIEIDPAAQTMALYANGTRIGHRYHYRHQLYMDDGSPYLLHRSRLPWENRKTAKKLLLDIGYPGGIVFWDEKQFRNATNLDEREELAAEGKGVLFFGIVRFGKLVFKNIPIFIAPDAPARTDNRDGIIGATMFRPFKYAFDFNRHSLWLSPTQKTTGIGFQITNEVIYTPGNEDFVQKEFKPKPCTMPKMTLNNSPTLIPQDENKRGTGGLVC